MAMIAVVVKEAIRYGKVVCFEVINPAAPEDHTVVRATIRIENIEWVDINQVDDIYGRITRKTQQGFGFNDRKQDLLDQFGLMEEFQLEGFADTVLKAENILNISKSHDTLIVDFNCDSWPTNVVEEL